MASSREGLKLEQRSVSPSLQNVIFQDRFPVRGLGQWNHSHDVSPPILSESVPPRTLILPDTALNIGPIDLLDQPRAKLFREPSGGFARLSDQYRARNRPIKPMHQPDVDPARFVVS